MIQQVAWTLAANVASQAFVFVALIYFASVVPAALFGEFSVSLSIAAIFAIFITCQIERIYILLDADVLRRQVGVHMIIVALFSAAAFIASSLFLGSTAMSASVVGCALAINQIGTYFFSRVGDFSKLYALKLGQGTITAILLLASAVFSMEDFAPYGYALGWALPSMALLAKNLNLTPTQHDIDIFTTSIRRNGSVLRTSMVSMMAVTMLREAPVLIVGHGFGAAYAGTVGLVNRMLGQPMGLLAKSISPVMNNLLAQEGASRSALRKLFLLIGVAILLCVLILILSLALRPYLFSGYILLSETFLILFVPMVLQFIIGVGGSLIIVLSLHSLEMRMYLCQIVMLVTGILVVMSQQAVEATNDNYLAGLTVYATSCAAPAIGFIIYLIRKVR